MDPITDTGLSLPIFLTYGLVILLYLIILRKLLDVLQRRGDGVAYQRSVVDRDIQRTMTGTEESSMHAFNVRNLATTIAKALVSVVAMGVMIILSVVKFGPFATVLMIVMCVSVLYAYNRWQKSREKPSSVRAEIRKGIDKAGNTGMIIMLSIVLVALLFVMIVIH